VGVAEGDRVVGWIALADTLKLDAAEAVAHLQALGLQPALVTGDNDRVAEAIAAELGIQDVRSEALPADKIEIVAAWQSRGEIVAAIGDGMNDAPALERADVGIALGTGADIALDSADIAIAGDELMAAVRAIALSQATFRRIKQNLTWAYGYNLVMLPIAMAGLLHPIMAEVAMALSSLTVIWNSLQLKRVRLPETIV
ncbi:MAG: HAD-IC family P-type ATPase, partial [Cyanobacteria bacterium J06648_11]